MFLLLELRGDRRIYVVNYGIKFQQAGLLDASPAFAVGVDLPLSDCSGE